MLYKQHSPFIVERHEMTKLKFEIKSLCFSIF